MGIMSVYSVLGYRWKIKKNEKRRQKRFQGCAGNKGGWVSQRVEKGKRSQVYSGQSLSGSSHCVRIIQTKNVTKKNYIQCGGKKFQLFQ